MRFLFTNVANSATVAHTNFQVPELRGRPLLLATAVRTQWDGVGRSTTIAPIII
jgi:hypothetical protein